ncbi:hypothetical protein ACP6L2_00330 [Sphingobacterium lactis]|uniref:hypothetical protein n=1 Tax=Sphingobacterium lactis TaxID=797291 RepID=UPI003F7FE830
MRGINAIKHAELIHFIMELEELYSGEELDDNLENLQVHKEQLDALHQEYLKTLSSLQQLVIEYRMLLHHTKQICINKPVRKIFLKNKIKTKREIVKRINNLAG